MSGPVYTPFDFRNAGTADVVVRSLKTWLTKSEGTFSDSWEAIANSKADLSCDMVLSRTFEEGVQSGGGVCVGYSVLLGAEDLPTLVCISNADAISIANYVVGNGLDAEPEERKLTSIEVSLCRMLIETFGSALSIAFMGTEPLQIRVGEYDDAPQLSRLIPVEELVLSNRIRVSVEDVSVHLNWLVPRKPIEQLFETTMGTQLTRAANHPKEIVLHLPLDLVGILGETVMEMADVADLKIGDIVTLDQKIDEPLTLRVDETDLFKCWPGRIGRQQGLQIEKVL